LRDDKHSARRSNSINLIFKNIVGSCLVAGSGDRSTEQCRLTALNSTDVRRNLLNASYHFNVVCDDLALVLVDVETDFTAQLTNSVEVPYQIVDVSAYGSVIQLNTKF
jgi:hypothetical protein